MWKTASPDRYEILKDFAKQNRNNPTEAEKVFWEMVRANRCGYKIVRQQIIGDYIVDFYCLTHQVVVEIDGGYHSEREQAEDDQQRTDWLESIGCHVIRFKNDEILYEYEKVKATLIGFIKRFPNQP